MTDVVLASSDVPVDFAAQMHMAQVLADASLLPGHLRGKPANVLVILQGARALNVPAFWALQSMHVIEGKLSMSAELMRALVVRAGHRFRIVERTLERAVVEIHRKDRDEPYRFEFTADDAKSAELAGKGNWKKYPKAMLLARATTGAVRDECPDVLFGVVYSPDELGAVTDEEGNPEYVEGQIIQVPTPEKVADLSQGLLAASANLSDFTAAWQAVTDLGWAQEKIPEVDLSLADFAAELLRDVAREAQTTEELKTIWNIGRFCGLMNMVVAPAPGVVDDDARLLLGAYLKARGEFVANAEKAEVLKEEAEVARATLAEGLLPQASQEETGPSTVLDGEIVDGGVVETEIDTDNARRLREAAAESWGDKSDE